MVCEVWIGPLGHPGITVVVGVVVVYRVFGASFKAEVNLGHLSEVFACRKKEEAHDGDPRRVGEGRKVAACARDLR